MYYIEAIEADLVILHLSSILSNSLVLINLTIRLKKMGIIKMIRECSRKDELEILFL